MKNCVICGRFFRGKSYRQTACKGACSEEKARRYKQQYRIKWYEENRAHALKYAAQRRDVTNQQRRSRYAAHPEEHRAKRKAYRDANPQRVRKWGATNREKHPEKRRAAFAKWYEKNRGSRFKRNEKPLAAQRKRRASRAAAKAKVAINRGMKGYV